MDIIIFSFALLLPFVAKAQGNGQRTYEDLDNPFARIETGLNRQSQGYQSQSRQHIQDRYDSEKIKYPNPWILYGSIGLHTFRGDFSNIGKISGTISPQWSIGVGKWLTSWIGLKVEFMKSRTDGYTRFPSGHYGYGPDLYTEDGILYRKMQTRWLDVSGNIMLNLSRIFLGYAGTGENKLMNHIIGGLGLGAVHHLGFENSGGSDNDIAAHAFLQYSRFFNADRNFSVDLTLGGIFYKSNQDIIDLVGSSLCCNLGLSVGLTWYLGQSKKNQSRHYPYDFSRNATHKSLFTDNEVVERNGVTQAISFYVMYPDTEHNTNRFPEDERELGDWLIGNASDPSLVINSHSGLSYVYSTFGRNKGEAVVSFADMYAAMNGIEGDFHGKCDASTVGLLNKLLSKGVVTLIEMHRAGDVVNLDDYRTLTMVNWLKSHPMFSTANTIVYVDNNFLSPGMRKAETGDLTRCVKVKLQVVY